jgi:cyclic pyranopterin phosphate synthase
MSTPPLPTHPQAGTRPAAPLDVFGRPLRSLRISVTDRCNMRCRYCMPERDYVWLPRESILTFEEIARLVGIFAGLGVDRVRLTGGEPLLRHDLPLLIRLLRGQAGLRDLALTTNGILLARQAAELQAAGLDRVTISLDTLRPERLEEFARSSRHADILDGIDSVLRLGMGSVKINSVIIRGYNDDEVIDLLEYGRARKAEIRLIEYMDVGGATEWSMEQVLSQREMLELITRHYGPIEPVGPPSSAPAERFALPDGTVFGVIASTTLPFCRSCDRSRLTADGEWLLCLYGEAGLDLRESLRLGRTDDQIREQIAATWQARSERGAEERAQAPHRGVLYQLEALRADPHREMHTRGG